MTAQNPPVGVLFGETPVASGGVLPLWITTEGGCARTNAPVGAGGIVL
jgi:hypothetical protein